MAYWDQATGNFSDRLLGPTKQHHKLIFSPAVSSGRGGRI